ncbi:hypothetical protein D3C80_1922240 [compost metagenome]
MIKLPSSPLNVTTPFSTVAILELDDFQETSWFEICLLFPSTVFPNNERVTGVTL